MAVVKARGQITIIDQNDAVSFQAFINSNQPLTQIYTQDTNTYQPNWAVSPYLVLTPQLFISGIPGDSISVPGRIKAGTSQWRRDGVLLSNGGDYAIQSAAPYSLTVKKNENVGGGNVKFQFSAILVDPSNELETNFSAVISFNTVQNSSAGLALQITSEEGFTFDNDQVPTVSLTAELFRGADPLTANVTYAWGIRDFGIFAPTTVATSAATGQKIVNFTSVNNIRPGSPVRIGSANYVVASVNNTSKAVTMTTNLTTAVASGAAITSPYYDAEFGAGWAKITSDPYFNGITGFNAKTLIIPKDAVQGSEVFKVIAKDTSAGSSTSGKSSTGTQVVRDMSDPIQLQITSVDGEVIKNGAGQIRLLATVIDSSSGSAGLLDGDPDGNKYQYLWSKYDKDGVNVPSFTKTGKTITVLPSDVTVKATFFCTLMTID